MGSHVLPYDHAVVPQETGFWCGPAATQVVLNSRGVIVSEQDMANQIGTSTSGTDYIGLITPVLNRYLDGEYVDRYIENDPARPDQVAQLWSDIVRSIDAGFGVVANIVAPPNNYPRGIKGSSSPAYSGGTVFHYIAIMGYDDDPASRAVWIADSGFRPFGYWCSFNQLATLIPPKGYAAVPGVRTMRGLDYAGGRPGGAAIKAAGFDFVVRYLAPGGTSLPGKLLTPAEADDLRAHGVLIVSNWESYADRMLEGRAAGSQDAHSARAQALRCGGTIDRPIYFSADWDASAAEQAPIDDYLRGAAEVIGAENVGIYGGYWSCSRALNNGTAAWAWQTDAWSGGRVDHRINLHQRIGFITVGGVECDVNEAKTQDFGQWHGGTDMALLDETFVNWQGHRVTVGTALKYMDLYNGLILDQVLGPGARVQEGKPVGWTQLGLDSAGKPRTLVDGVAAALAGQAQLAAKLDALTEALGLLAERLNK
jgi:hypothetical protein